MTRRTWLPFLVACALAAPLPAASAAPARTMLKGTVKITASYSAVIEVRLPKRVDVGDGVTPPKGTTVSGAGRLYGVVLLAADRSTPSIQSLVYGFCTTTACPGANPVLRYWAVDGRFQSHVVLPAGDYRLLVVTDGKPVTAVLTLPGLSGSQTVRAVRRVHVQHETTSYLGGVPGAPATVVYEGATDAAIDGGHGLLFHQFQVQTDASVQQNVGFCLYWAPVLSDPAPACPGGAGVEASRTTQQLTPSSLRMWGYARYLSEGSYRAGVYYNAVGAAHDPIGVVTWITLPA